MGTEKKKCFAHVATRPRGQRAKETRAVLPGAHRIRGHRGRLVPRATSGTRMEKRSLPSKGRGLQVGSGGWGAPGQEARKCAPQENKLEEVRMHSAWLHPMDHHLSSWVTGTWNLTQV